MSYLSRATIRKFIRESFSETDKPIKVPRKQQEKWLNEQAERLQAGDNVTVNLREDNYIEVWVSSADTFMDCGTFMIGFGEKGTNLVVAHDYFFELDSDQLKFVGDIEDVDTLIAAIKQRFECRIVKKKQRSTTDTFTLQGLKSQVYELCKQHGLDFCISKRSYWYLVFVRKPEYSDYLVIRINGSKKKAASEIAKLPKYVEYAAGHFEFYHAVERVGGKRTAHVNYGVDWVNCSSPN